MSAGEAHLGVEVASILWSLGERLSSIHHRDLLTIFYALQYFLPFGQNSAVAVSVDNTTALAFLRNQGGHQSRGFWAGRLMIFCAGGAPFHLFCLSSSWGSTPCWRILFSRLNPILGSVWTLKLSVFQQLRRRWPVSPDLFATSLTHCCLPYFSPFHNSNALGTEVLLKPGDGWRAYRMLFLTMCLFLRFCKLLRSSSGVLLTTIVPYWPRRPWFPELLELVVDDPVALPLDRVLLSQPHVHRQHLGLSRLALHAWRLSSDL